MLRLDLALRVACNSTPSLLSTSVVKAVSVRVFGDGGALSGVEVSIVVPAFNEGQRLPHTLEMLAASLRVLEETLGCIELIVVDDGSSDDTAAVAQSKFSLFSRAQLISLPWNCGKGAAVRAGVMAAHGRAIVFMDADLSADLRMLPAMISRLVDADVVLGSRRADGAEVNGRTRSRHIGGIAYNQLAQRLTGIAFHDTQCGFKAFRADAGKVLFSLCRSSGFGFDVEICAAAVAMGLRIVELPIQWSATDGGTVRLRAHAAGMLMDLLRARSHRIRSRSIAINVCHTTTRLRQPEYSPGSMSPTGR